jgi:hypothetical protein
VDLVVEEHLRGKISHTAEVVLVDLLVVLSGFESFRMGKFSCCLLKGGVFKEKML